MQFLVKLACYFNVMFSPAVMMAGFLLWQSTAAESKRCRRQAQKVWDEGRVSTFTSAEVG